MILNSINNPHLKEYISNQQNYYHQIAKAEYNY